MKGQGMKDQSKKDQAEKNQKEGGARLNHRQNVEV